MESLMRSHPAQWRSCCRDQRQEARHLWSWVAMNLTGSRPVTPARYQVDTFRKVSQDKCRAELIQLTSLQHQLIYQLLLRCSQGQLSAVWTQSSSGKLRQAHCPQKIS